MYPILATLLLLCLTSSVGSASLSSPECNNTVHVNGKYYVSEKIKDFNGIPADISVNFNTGNIYFTLINSEMKMSLYRLKERYQMEKLNVNNLGQSSMVDNVNNVVYLATDSGVYRYNENTGTAKIYSALQEDVMYVAVAENGRILYIATWPQNRVQRIVGRKSELFKPIANGHGLTIDNDNNIYYEAVKTPYVLRNGEEVSIRINGFKADSMVDFFVAKSGETFAMDEHSNLFKIDPLNVFATNLGTFNMEEVNTFGMDQDNNILIGVKDSLWKWVPHSTNPCN